jgi:hypothetical protein
MLGKESLRRVYQILFFEKAIPLLRRLANTYIRTGAGLDDASALS